MNCPFSYIVAIFGLSHQAASFRIDIAAVLYPNRWTHHLLVSRPEKIDEELMGWIKEAADFAEKIKNAP